MSLAFLLLFVLYVCIISYIFRCAYPEISEEKTSEILIENLAQVQRHHYTVQTIQVSVQKEEH
jgi:Na+-transporting methylmalonyl-CoA/oxaloacetate decarboxylase gamma subunit